MLTYDPITGKVTLVGKLPEETRAPIVTPDQSQAKPKVSPTSGSAPSIQPKNYYLRGEEVPKGIKTKLGKVDVNGEQIIARIPIAPELSEEDKKRIDAETNKLNLSYGYDPKTGEFGMGLVENDPVKPVAPQVDSMGNPVDGVATGADLAAIDVRKQAIGNELLQAKINGDQKTYSRLTQEGLELDKLAREYEAKNLGDTYYDDYLINPAINIATGIVAPFSSDIDGASGDDFNKLSTGITHVLTRSLLGMAATAKEEAAVGALAGSAIPAVGTGAGAGIGFLAGTTSYYTGLNLYSQQVNRVREMEALYGENFASIPESDKTKMISDADAARAIIAGLGETAVDGMLGAAFKPLSKLIKVPKATSIIPKSILGSPIAKRAVGATGALLGAGAVGGVTEGAQSWLEMWGQSVEGGLPDLINDENIRNEVITSALVGGIIGTSLAGTGVATQNGGDLVVAAARKFTGKSPADSLSSPKSETVTDGLDTVDTTAYEVEVGSDNATPPVTTPVAPEVKETNTRKEPDTTPLVRKEKSTKQEKKAWDVWNEYYENRVTKFENSLKDKQPSDIYNTSVVNGDQDVVTKTFEQVAGPVATPLDGTPQTAVANNIVKGLDESVQTAKFYDKLKNDPEALTTFANAIEASKADPVRQEKIAKMKAVVPSIPDVMANTLSTKALDAIESSLPSVPEVVKEIAAKAPEVITSPEISVNPMSSIEKAKSEADAVIASAPPSDPKALLDQVVKPVTIADDTDPLRIPDFLRRTKPKEGSSNLSETRTWTDDTLYANDPVTNIEYVPVLNKTLPPDLVDDVTKIAVDSKNLIGEVAKRLMGGTLGSSLTTVVVDDIVIERTNQKTGQKTYSRAGGEQRNHSDGTRAVILNIGYDIRQKLAGKFSKSDNLDTFETIIHELTHDLDTNQFLTKDMQRVFDKALKDYQKELGKRPDLMGIIDKFDVNTANGRAEVLAYAIGDYASRSSNKAAVELRKAFGIEKVDDPTFKEPGNAVLRRVINTILEAIKAIQNYLKEKVDKSFASKRDAERLFDTILSGDFGRELDRMLVDATDRQLNAFIKAKRDHDFMFSVSKLTKETPSKATIDKELARSLKRNKEIAVETPDRQLDLTDYIYDPNNTTGWNNQLSSWLSGLGHWRNWSKVDADAAWSSTLALKREQAGATLHGAWAKAFQWVKDLPDKRTLFTIALDLKAQDVSLNGDGPVVYTNRNGKKVQLSKDAVDKIRDMSKVFSLPLDFHAQVTRGKMEAIARVPAFNSFPARGTVAEMQQWIKQKKDDLREQEQVSPNERKLVNDLNELIEFIKDFEGYKRNGVPYVPEMRSGNWALRVTDEKGELVGLYTMLAPGGGKPSPKEVQRVHKMVVDRYKNRPNLVITPPDGVFQMTYNNIGKFVKNPSQVDINLVTYLVTQKTLGLLKDKGGLSPEGYKSLQADAIAGDVMAHYRVRGFGKHLLTSRHIDGASTDVDYVISAFANSAAKSAANFLYGDLMNDTLSAYAIKAAETGTPQGRKFKNLFNKLSYAMDPVADAPGIRQFQYLWTLGLNPSTAAIQLTPLLGTVPMNIASLGIPLKASYSAMMNAMRYLGPTVANKLAQGETGEWFSEKTLRSMEPMFKGSARGKEAFEFAIKSALSDSAILNAALPDEARRGTMDKLDQGYGATNLSIGQRASITIEKASEFAGGLMSLTERAARVGTYFATIKSLYLNPNAVKTALSVLEKDKGFSVFRKFNPGLDDIRAITVYTVMDSFGNPEKGMRPDYTKGWFGALAAPFASIPHQLYGSIINNLRGRRGWKGRLGAAYALAQLAVTFGLNAALPTTLLLTAFVLEAMDDEPGELQIKAMLVDSFLGSAVKDLTGWSDKQVAEVLYSGVVSSLVGADLSGRMGMAAPLSRQISEMAKAFQQGGLPDLSAVTGVVGQTIGTGLKAIDQYKAGRLDLGEALTSMAPAAIRNPVNALRMAIDSDTGVKKTSLGKEIMRYKDMSTTDLILRGLGFTTNPEKEANLRNRIDALAGAARSSLKSNYKARLVELGGRAKASSDPSVAAEYRNEYSKLREEFYATVARIKEDDPAEYELYFTDKKLKEWEREIRKGVNRWADPGTTEGLSENQKRTREKYDRLLK